MANNNGGRLPRGKPENSIVSVEDSPIYESPNVIETDTPLPIASLGRHNTACV